MPRRPTRTVPTVLLTGPLADGDWPHWLAAELTAAGRAVHRCTVTGPDSAALIATLADLPADGFDVVAHSVGCLVWLHHAAAATDSPRPARVALIAPPAAESAPAGSAPAVESASADWAAFFPVPLDIDAVRKAADGTVLVGSDNDPHCPAGVAAEYGAPLKMATTVVTGAGGFTAADGYGPWPAVLDWCGRDNLAFRA